MTERPLIQLGPRAAFLLGYLSEPLTAAEIVVGLDAARDLLDVEEISEAAAELLGGVHSHAPTVTVAALLDGGLDEVLYQLRRLEVAGYVRRLGDLGPRADRGALWFRVPPAEW